MKILVTGAGGQLGHDVCLKLGGEAVGVDIANFDITNRDAVCAYIEKLRPDTIIHCAAYTAVDKAESEPELCRSINALGTHWLAEAANNIDAKFLYISTDYVFDGTLDRSYDIDDAPNPLSVYGRTKLEGEQVVQSIVKKHFIVRTSWVYGANGGNFVNTMLRLGRERGEVSVVADQIGSPTYTKDLADLVGVMIHTDKYGVYHATNEGFCSWAEFAAEVMRQSGSACGITKIPSEEYPTKAVRPKNSRMSKTSLDKAGFERLPEWKDALERYMLALGTI